MNFIWDKNLMAKKQHSGLWADLRVVPGMKAACQTSNVGQQFICMVLAGRDAASAAGLGESRKLSDEKIAGDMLQHLRFGSNSETATKHQTALGLTPDPSKMIGPTTRQALTNLQTKKLKWADEIYSPAMERELGLGVFDPLVG